MACFYYECGPRDFLENDSAAMAKKGLRPLACIM